MDAKRSDIKYLIVLFFVTMDFSVRINAQETVRTTEGTVSYLMGQSIYVKFESTEGIEDGDTLFVNINKLEPALVVQHCTHPERMSVRWLIHRAWLHAQSRAVISFVDLVTQDRRSRFRIIFSYTLAVVKETLRLMASWLVLPFRNRRHYPYWQNYVVEHIRPQIARIGSNLRLANLFAQGKRE